jgi:hypothetical protein
MYERMSLGSSQGHAPLYQCLLQSLDLIEVAVCYSLVSERP